MGDFFYPIIGLRSFFYTINRRAWLIADDDVGYAIVFRRHESVSIVDMSSTVI